MKRIIKLFLLAATLFSLAGCQKKKIDGSFVINIYQSDTNNYNLSDNPLVVSYTIEYYQKAHVIDCLRKGENDRYYFNDTNNYVVLTLSQWGYSLSNGYFAELADCAEGEIDISWSYTAVNGEYATTAFGDTPLENLQSFDIVINGWKDMS